MPTPISHAAVGFAIGAWGQSPPPARRVCLIAAACAALPDIDYLGWPVPHRSITHSVIFAAAGALIATAIFFRQPEWSAVRTRLCAILALGFLSHGLLDGLSSYSFGVAYWAPFSWQRYRFNWTPLGNANGDLRQQLIQEFFVVFVPALLLGWLAFNRRGRA